MPRDSGNKGLRIGDRILSINGESVTRLSTSGWLSNLLTGPLGSSVDIVVDRVVCVPQPLALSVPRSSIEEHFGGKVFRDGEIILQGWIAKDGRFSSEFKRRWAQLSFESRVFKFRWGESGPAGFVERGSAAFKYLASSESVSVTPIDLTPHGQQLSSPSSNFGFLLHFGGRAMNIFCDSKFSRDLWVSVLNVAKRPIRVTSCPVPSSPLSTAAPGFSTMQKLKLQSPNLTKRELRSILWNPKYLNTSMRAAKEIERLQQEQLHLQLEQEGVQLQDTAASGGLSEGDIVALLQSTVARVQALARQNTRLHTENCAQNVVIDHLTAQIKQQQLQAAIIFRQVAQLACLADNYSDEGSDFMLASKFAANILADVLGPRHPHAVAASDNGLGRNYRTSLESLAAFTTAYSTSTTASSANANASKQQLYDAAHRSNEVFQQQRPRHL